MMIKNGISLVLIAIALTGCTLNPEKATPATAPSATAPEEVKPTIADGFVRYSYRQGYSVWAPEGWMMEATPSGDKVMLSPKGDPWSVESPGVRIFTRNFVPELPPDYPTMTPEQLVGSGYKPYMKVQSAEATTVESVVGPVPGFILYGGEESKGATYKGLGLFVEGKGQEIRLYCTSPEEVWPEWEPLCRQIVQRFQPGDLSRPRK